MVVLPTYLFSLAQEKGLGWPKSLSHTNQDPKNPEKPVRYEGSVRFWLLKLWDLDMFRGGWGNWIMAFVNLDTYRRKHSKTPQTPKANNDERVNNANCISWASSRGQWRQGLIYCDMCGHSCFLVWRWRWRWHSDMGCLIIAEICSSRGIRRTRAPTAEEVYECYKQWSPKPAYAFFAQKDTKSICLAETLLHRLIPPGFDGVALHDEHITPERIWSTKSLLTLFMGLHARVT